MNAIAILDNNKGYVYFEQRKSNEPVKIYFDLKNFQSNSTHAIHIHEYGDLRNGCMSLGSHFNPTNTKHSYHEKGHAGDLINNFTTNRQGNFRCTYKTEKISLFPGELNVIGRSIVIHKFSDDLGLGGIFHGQGFTPYYDLSNETLQITCKKLGYNINLLNRNTMIKKLMDESITTGNASTRISCGIIGLSV